jgi:hypothetical protein
MLKESAKNAVHGPILGWLTQRQGETVEDAAPPQAAATQASTTVVAMRTRVIMPGSYSARVAGTAYVRLDGWTSGSVPLQPEARTRTLVGGVTTPAPPLKRGRRSE